MGNLNDGRRGAFVFGQPPRVINERHVFAGQRDCNFKHSVVKQAGQFATRLSGIADADAFAQDPAAEGGGDRGARQIDTALIFDSGGTGQRGAGLVAIGHSFVQGLAGQKPLRDQVASAFDGLLGQCQGRLRRLRVGRCLGQRRLERGRIQHQQHLVLFELATGDQILTDLDDARLHFGGQCYLSARLNETAADDGQAATSGLQLGHAHDGGLTHQRFDGRRWLENL